MEYPLFTFLACSVISNLSLPVITGIRTMIKGVVFATEISNQNSDFNKWMWQLRDAIDEANDVLDGFMYTKLKEQQTRKVPSTTKKLGKIVKRALNIDSSLKRLEKVLRNLDKISIDISSYLPLLETTEKVQQRELDERREEGSMTMVDLIDRVKDKMFVMNWLSKPSNEEHQTHITATTLDRDISLLSIVGLAGVGKTLLLQHVFKDKETEEFYPKMWISISKVIDEKEVIEKMVQCLKMEKPNLDSLDLLQKSLKLEIQKCQKSEGKPNKFLLVLDDIWQEEKKIKWDCVFTALAEGGLGGKILVTTRTDSVALMIAKALKQKVETLRLGDLEKDYCLQLLESLAFLRAEMNGIDVENLRSIAGDIVKKLSGSPMEARAIGEVLNNHVDESSWKLISDGDFESLRERPKEIMKEGQKKILSILRFSYTFLPTQIQNCFAFCGIFPQGHNFDKEDLVRMWVALDFIQQPSEMNDTVEVEGRRYFHVLAKNFLFDKFRIEYRKCYKMHDLLCKLANSVSKDECFRVVGNEKLLIIPKAARHLSVEISNPEELRERWKFEKLHSLFLFYEGNGDLFALLKEIFKTSRSIRLLCIYAPYLERIPKEIECLIHLRYLKLDRTSVTQLPMSLSSLYHLKFLIYEEKAEFLPNNFSGICEIGNLNSLQGLNGFYVKNEIGYEIEELEHMNELRQLKIKLLENVNDADKACKAKLCAKKNLTDLALEWSPRDNADSNLDEMVLEKLEPNRNLKKLRINAYMGAKSATWIDKIDSISNLEYIKLDGCLKWQNLPPFGQLHFLKYLYLQNMPKVERLNNKFPKLKVLHIENLTALEVWFDVAASNHCRFPCLTELYLKDCPNLQEFSSLPPKLEDLEVDNIGWKTFNWLEGTSNRCNISIQNCLNLISLRGLQEVETIENFQLILSELVINDPSVLLMETFRRITSLEKLAIQDNDEQVSFPIVTKQWFLQVSSSLCKLYFWRLKSLQSLPSFLENLTSLKILHVREVPQLQLLPNIPASLEDVLLEGLESLQCLPSSWSISSLKNLELRSIPLLKSPLTDLPPSLRVLQLSSLENLHCLHSCLPSLISLQKLFIFKIPQLRELPDLPPSLCVLKLGHLEYLNCLPSCLPKLSSLHKLCIDSVPQLRELPDLPPSLKHLSIENCHSELMERYKMFSGSDWHKIAHIPQVRVSNKW